MISISLYEFWPRHSYIIVGYLLVCGQICVLDCGLVYSSSLGALALHRASWRYTYIIHPPGDFVCFWQIFIVASYDLADIGHCSITNFESVSVEHFTELVGRWEALVNQFQDLLPCSWFYTCWERWIEVDHFLWPCSFFFVLLLWETSGWKSRMWVYPLA